MSVNYVILCLSLYILAAPLIQAQPAKGTNAATISNGFVDVDGGKLYYEEAGTGENIVLIHDGLIHNEIWDGQFLEFAKFYRVIRYDRRGYGKSTPPAAPYSNVDDLEQLFLRLKVDKAVLFGMSAGGGLAIDFTLRFPEKVTGLVLVGAVVSGYGYTSHMFTRGGHLKSLAELRANPQKMIAYFGSEDPYEIYPGNTAAKEKCLKLLQANPQNVDEARQRYFKPESSTAASRLGGIKVPALVLVGEFDIPDVHAHSGVIEFGIPGAKREIIGKAGHLIPLEQPGEFNRVSLTFLFKARFYDKLNHESADAAMQYIHAKLLACPDWVILEKNEMHQLANGAFDKYDPKTVVEICRLYVKLYPDAAYAYQYLGDACRLERQTDEAIKNYRKALELKPGMETARQSLDELLKKQ